MVFKYNFYNKICFTKMLLKWFLSQFQNKFIFIFKIKNIMWIWFCFKKYITITIPPHHYYSSLSLSPPPLSPSSFYCYYHHYHSLTIIVIVTILLSSPLSLLSSSSLLHSYHRCRCHYHYYRHNCTTATRIMATIIS